jgi:hypothetical protein
MTKQVNSFHQTTRSFGSSSHTLWFFRSIRKHMWLLVVCVERTLQTRSIYSSPFPIGHCHRLWPGLHRMRIKANSSLKGEKKRLSSENQFTLTNSFNQNAIFYFLFFQSACMSYIYICDHDMKKVNQCGIYIYIRFFPTYGFRSPIKLIDGSK